MNVRLTDICDIQYGYAFDSALFSEIKGTPLVRIRDVVRGFSETRTTELFPPEYTVKNGDILIGMDGEFNIARWNGGIAALNQRVCRLIPKKVDADYIFYFMPSALKAIEAKTSFVTVKHLSAKELNKITVPIPTLDEQIRIGSVLNRVSHIIETRKRELQALDDLVKARFVEMFEQGKYDKVEFGSICVFLRNGANIKQTKGAGGYPITRIETLANDAFNADRLGYADIIDLDKYQNYLLKKGDILISHINSVAYLGRAVQYRGQLDTPVIHGMNLLCARIIEGYNPTYIEFFFKTPMVKDYISTITKKAVNQASITTSDLKKMMIPAAPLSEQNEFDAFVQQINKSKSAVQKALDQAQLLFDSLMQKYFG